MYFRKKKKLVRKRKIVPLFARSFSIIAMCSSAHGFSFFLSFHPSMSVFSFATSILFAFSISVFLFIFLFVTSILFAIALLPVFYHNFFLYLSLLYIVKSRYLLLKVFFLFSILFLFLFLFSFSPFFIFHSLSRSLDRVNRETCLKAKWDDSLSFFLFFFKLYDGLSFFLFFFKLDDILLTSLWINVGVDIFPLFKSLTVNSFSLRSLFYRPSLRKTEENFKHL